MDFQYNYKPLSEPIPITEQVWPEGTMPLVSISTLTYNHEAYIKDCIEGFLMQKTTFPVRICIFEDCSTDNTAKIIKEYQAKYPNLIFAFCQDTNTYGKPNRKEAGNPFREARNIAKYIAMCEGDDFWTDPLKLQKQVDFLEANTEYVLCFHNCDVVIEGNLNYTGSGVRRDLETREYTGYDLLQKWTIHTATVIYKNCFKPDQIKPKHKDLMSREIHFFLALAEKGKLYCINEKMSVYRRHSGGVTQIPKDIATRVKFLKNYIAKDIVYNYKYHEILKIKIANISFYIAKEYLKKGNPKALKYVLLSLKYDSNVLKNFILKKIHLLK